MSSRKKGFSLDSMVHRNKKTLYLIALLFAIIVVGEVAYDSPGLSPFLKDVVSSVVTVFIIIFVIQLVNKIDKPNMIPSTY